MTSAFLTDGTTQIIVALIAASGLIGVAWVQLRGTRATRAEVDQVAETIGDIDHGDESADLTVVEMLREILKGQTHQDVRIAAAEGKLAKHHDRLTAHAERLDHQGHRIDLHGHRLDALEKSKRLEKGEG